jgi:hypothetical protein
MWMVVSSQVAAVRIDASETVASRKTRDSQVVGAQSSLSRPLPWTGSSRCRWIDTGTSSPPRGEPEPRDRGVRRCVSPVRSYLPGSAGRAPCSIGRVRLVGVSSQWEVLATGTRALGSAVMPGTLFSCARSWFSIKGQSEAPSAAVLLDAQDPRRPAPPPPGLTPTGAGLSCKASQPLWLEEAPRRDPRRRLRHHAERQSSLADKARAIDAANTRHRPAPRLPWLVDVGRVAGVLPGSAGRRARRFDRRRGRIVRADGVTPSRCGSSGRKDRGAARRRGDCWRAARRQRGRGRRARVRRCAARGHGGRWRVGRRQRGWGRRARVRRCAACRHGDRSRARWRRRRERQVSGLTVLESSVCFGLEPEYATRRWSACSG